MVNREIYRGDDYLLKRPVFVYELVEPELDPITNLPVPFNMQGCTIRTTFKVAPTDPTTDPTDATAPIKAEIQFDNTGEIVGTPVNFALPPGGTAAQGVLFLILPRSVTISLPVGTVLRSDLQITDADDEDTTVPVLGVLSAIEGYTNRRV